MAQITYGSITVSDLTDGKNANIWTTTVAPTTPDYTFNISNLIGSDDEPREGDIILYDVYRYTISSIGTTTVLAGNRQSLQGEPGTPGSPGAPGSPGTPGASVTKTETEYYRKLAGGQAPQPSTAGSTTIPEYVDGCTYYTRTVTYLSVGGPVKGEWLEATTLTNQIKDAYEAWIAAGAVEQKAKSIVQDSSGVTVAAGINGADVTPGTTSTYGYNTIMAPTYLGLRYNAINLAKLSTTESTPELQFYFPSFSGSSNTPVQGDKGLTLGTSGMNFYHPGSSTADVTLNSNGLTITNGAIQFGSGGSSGTSAGNIRLANVDFNRSINNTNRTNLRLAIGSKFGVKNDGTLYASNADINGVLTAGANSKIGPWNVTDSSIWYGNSTFGNANGIYLGTSGLSLGSAFQVTSAGIVTANNITATGGKIGGWNIGTDTNKSLYYGNQVPGATTSNLVLSPISTTNTNAIAGSETGKTWFISAGQKFGVDTSGNLYATGATISGKITVGEGSNVYTTDGVNPLEIGGRNLFGLGSQCESLDGFTVSGSWNITTEDGFKCAHTTGELNTTKYIQSVIPFTPKPLERVTFSAYVKAKNIVQGSTNPMNAFYFNGHTIDGSWKGCLYYDAYVDGEFVRHGGSLANVYFSALINDSKWHHFAVTATFDDAAFSEDIPPYIFFRDCTGDLYIRDIKYERGNKATDWTPAPEDIDNIQVGGRNLLRNSKFDNGVAVNITSGAAVVSYGAWKKENLCNIEYVASSDYLKVMHNDPDAPTSKYGVYQDVVIKPNTDYVLSTESTGVCYIGYQFTGETSGSIWPSDDGNWTSANGRWSKVIRTNESTHNRCRIYVYSPNPNVSSRLQRIKLEVGNKATDWSPAPEDTMSMNAIHTVDCIENDTSYAYQQLISWSSRTDPLSWNVESTAGINVGDTVRMGIIASDMGANGTKVYLVGTVTSIDTATSLHAISKGLDTTVIDGGHILTGSIDANRMNANVINAVNNGTGKINADKINASQIDVGSLGGSIGGRNLVTHSLNLSDFLEESRANCPIKVYPESASITHTQNSTSRLGAYYNIQSPEVGAKYTLSFVASTATGDYSVGGSGTSSVWAGIVTYTAIKAGKNTVTFTVPSGATSLRIYFSVMAYNATTTISNVQLEKGSVATDWKPSPYDIEPKQRIKADKIQLESSTYVSYSVSGDSITMNRISTGGGNYGMYYDFPCEPNSFYTVSAKVTARTGTSWGIYFGYRDSEYAQGSVWSGLGRVHNSAGVGGYYISRNSTATASTQTHIRLYFCSTVSGDSWTIEDITFQKDGALATNASYVTHIDDNGIRIHPASTQNNSVVINANGMEVFKGGTGSANSVAFYGDDARIGKVDKSRVYITPDNGMRVYDKNNKKRMWLDWDGFYLYDDSEGIISSFTPSAITVGKAASGHTTIKSDGLHVWTGTESTATNEVAFFGSTSRIGKLSKNYIEITDSGLNFYDGANSQQFGRVYKGNYSHSLMLGASKDNYTYGTLELRGQDGKGIMTVQNGTSSSNKWCSLTSTSTAWSVALASYTSSGGTNYDTTLQLTSSKLSLYYNDIDDSAIKFSVVPSNGNVNTSGYYQSGGKKIITIGSVNATAKTVAANSYADPAISVSVAKTGYTPIAIVGYTMGGSSYCYPYRIYISGSTAYAYVRNFGSSSASLTVTFYVLYVASTQGV